MTRNEIDRLAKLENRIEDLMEENFKLKCEIQHLIDQLNILPNANIVEDNINET